jgi:hypothetical protein
VVYAFLVYLLPNLVAAFGIVAILIPLQHRARTDAQPLVHLGGN